MKRWLSTVCVLACVAGVFAADEKKSDVTAHATQLMIRKPLPPKKKEAFGFQDTGGTSVNISLDAPGKYVLGIDTKASKLGEFTDDKGTKLYTEGRFGATWLGDYPIITPEGDVCTVQVNGFTPPAKGAAKVRVKATVVLTCGTDEKSTDKKEVKIKKDAKEKVGDFSVEVTNEGGQFGGATLQIVSEKQNLKTAEFFDAKGEAVKLFLPPYHQTLYPTTPNGKNRYALMTNLPMKADAVTVKVTYFEKTQAVEAPVDLEFGVGLE